MPTILLSTPLMIKKALLLIYFCLHTSLLFSQSDSVKQFEVGLKANPTQLVIGEIAGTLELKYWKRYSAELKLGTFTSGPDDFGLFTIGSMQERIMASGYVVQPGIKRYFNSRRNKNRTIPRGFYLQGLGLYKWSSFQEKDIVGETDLDPVRNESQSIHTFGLKLQLGWEVRFMQYFYFEMYAGAGGRLRSINQTIHTERGKEPAGYPLQKYKNDAYLTPQGAMNIGFLVPFKRKYTLP